MAFVNYYVNIWILVLLRIMRITIDLLSETIEYKYKHWLLWS